MFRSKYYNILFIFVVVLGLFLLIKWTQENRLNKYMNSLSPEMKIGQLLMISPEGYTFDRKLKNLIQNYHIGNLKIFGKNYKNKYQLYKLIIEAQNTAITSHDIPMFIATDQEGGWIAHLKRGFTIPPSNFAIGKTGKTYLAYIASDIISKELRAVGINVNFAPDVDLHINEKNWVIGPRAYSDSPETVISFAEEFLKAHINNNVIPVIKHFPGQGRVAGDSHVTLLTNYEKYNVLIKNELKPFLTLTRTPETGIMIGHIAVPGIVQFMENIDNKDYKKYYFLPATISDVIINRYLLKFMDYKGLVFTDEMNMKGITDKFGVEEAIYLSIKAGANIIVIDKSYNEIKKIYNYLLRKYKSDKEFRKQVDISLHKIFIYKGMLFQHRNSAGYFSDKLIEMRKFEYMPEKLKIINSDFFKKIIFAVSKLTVDIYRDKYKVVPLNMTGFYKDKIYVVVSPRKVLFDDLKKFVPYNRIQYIPIKAGFTEHFSEEYIKSVVSKISDNSVVIFGLVSRENARLCRAVYDKNKNMILINLLHLYNIKKLTDIPVIINTYSDNEMQINAALEVLFNGKKEIINLHKEYLTF